MRNEPKDSSAAMGACVGAGAGVGAAIAAGGAGLAIAGTAVALPVVVTASVAACTLGIIGYGAGKVIDWMSE